jgi:hypothetical protein
MVMYATTCRAPIRSTFRVMRKNASFAAWQKDVLWIAV